jgi:hypothetical protein
MAATTSQEKYAAPEDWEAYKETICDIYWDQSKTLKELSEIMIRDHGFYAT